MPGEIEVKPCPFCGRDLIRYRGADPYWMHNRSVRSGDCFFFSLVVYPEQVELWNRRAAESVVVAELPPTTPAVPPSTAAPVA